jgi:hypothetical protein
MTRIKTLGLALFLSLSFLPAALSAKEHRNRHNNAWFADEREGRDRDRERDGGYYNQPEWHRNNGYYRRDRDAEDYYQRNWNREECYRGGWGRP